jgi:hypothetical protein
MLGALAVFAGLILNTMPRAVVRILEGRAALGVKAREK